MQAEGESQAPCAKQMHRACSQSTEMWAGAVIPGWPSPLPAGLPAGHSFNFLLKTRAGLEAGAGGRQWSACSRGATAGAGCVPAGDLSPQRCRHGDGDWSSGGTLGLGAAPWCLPQGICCALGYKGRVTGEDEHLPILVGVFGAPCLSFLPSSALFHPWQFWGKE